MQPCKIKWFKVSKQLTNIKVKQVAVDNIYLSFEDLAKIEKAKVKTHNKHYEDAKDWLILSLSSWSKNFRFHAVY